MKAFVASISIWALLVTSIHASGGDYPDRIFRFAELTDEDVARIDLKDTSVHDWLEVAGDPHLRPLDFVATGSGYDPSSFDFRVWLAWHDETDRLYVAAEYVDDIHVDFFDPSNEDFLASYGEPRLNFFIDGGDQGGGLVNPPSGPDGHYKFGRHVQWYWVCPGVFSDGVNLRMFTNSFFTPWVHLPPFADGGSGWFSENPTITIMEFYVTAFDILPWEGGPEDSVVSDLYPGKHISFALSISDLDTPLKFTDPPSLPDVAGYYSIRGPTYHEGADPWNADYWALGVLEGTGEVTPGNTAVRDLTWGRIKASLSE